MIPTIDLFAGAGGLALGLKEAGCHTLCAVEIDPYRVATFAGHTRGVDILTSDIQKVDFSAYREKVDLICGGPPCQPFSSGGLRKAAGDSRDMIPHFIRAVREVRPLAFLMENVPGLVTGDRFAYLAEVLREFEDQGYFTAWKVVNAADFGVPQKRRRLILIGMRHRRFVFPEETHGPQAENARGELFARLEKLLPHVAAQDVLPPQQIGEPNPSRVFYAKRPDLRPSPYDGHLFNGGGRPIDRTQPCPTILASAGGNKTHFFDDRGLVPEYHRQLSAGGKPRRGTLPGARRLTVLESALIQTFPRDIVFRGPRSSQYHQVGDAVPPLLAAVLGKALVAQLLARKEEADRRESPGPRRGKRLRA